LSNNNIEITITEKQILHLFYDNPALMDSIEVEFITSIAKEFHIVFGVLNDKKLSFIPEHVLKYKIEHINADALEAVLEIDYQQDKLDEYVKELNDYKLYSQLEEKIIKETLYELRKKGGDKLETLQKCYSEFGQILDKLETKDDEDKEYLNFSELIVEHKEIIKDRSQSIKQTTGCYHFDNLIPSVIPGLMVLAGFSGSCKSTFISYLERQRIIKRLPTIAINTELSKIGYTDSMLPSFLKVDYFDLLGINNEDVDYSKILEKMDELEEKYRNKTNYLYLNKYSASVKDIEKFALFARESMQLDKKRTLFCFVDLLSMVEEFNDSKTGFNKADNIEDALNRVNELSLENNILTVGTLQLKRKTENKKIERLEDIEKWRPNISDIKSSGAYEERSRFVATIHNPWSIVHRNPTNQVIKDTVDPILDIDLSKDTYFMGAGKRIQYLYQNEYKTLVPYFDTND